MTTLIKDYKRKTHYLHMLPPGKYFFEHPISFIYQIYEVTILDAKYNTVVALAKRKKGQVDVEKRKAWRKAHGLDRPNPGIFPWIGLVEEEEEGKSPNGESRQAGSEEQNGEAGNPQVASSTGEEPSTTAAVADDGSYLDFEGRRKRPPVKRWFGIWT